MSEIQTDLSALTVEEVLEAAKGRSLEALQALEEAERAGKNRTTLIEGLEKMQADLQNEATDEPDDTPQPPPEDPPDTLDPLTGDDAPPTSGEQEPGGDDTYPTAPEQDLPVDAERDDAPVDEILPVIRSGDWARISGNASKVPEYARGRDVEIITAVVRRAGPNTISDLNQEYQLEADPFTVKMRDSGEYFECTRAAFAAYGPDRGYLQQQIEEQNTEPAVNTLSTQLTGAQAAGDEPKVAVEA